MQVPQLPVEMIAQAVMAQSDNRLKCELIGPWQGVKVSSVGSLSHAQPHEVAFLANPKFINEVKTCQAGLVVLRPADKEKLYGDEAPRAMLLCDDPYAWFAFALQVVVQMNEKFVAGIHPKAIVDETAVIGENVRIDAGAVIEAGAQIDAGAWIGANCVVGRGAKIGEKTRLHPNVTVNYGCTIGKRCILHSACVVGSDGFGFAPFKGQWVKIPQVGSVRIEDDVEIGANTSVDRGALDDTVICRGSKLDNLIQVAHNCVIGEDCVLAGKSSMAGSAKLGRHVILGGAAGVNGHIKLSDNVTVGPCTTAISDPGEGKTLMGFYPAMDPREYQRSAVLVKNLPEMRKQLKALEAQVKSLESQLATKE